jgi:hypothetical protein
MAGGVGSVKRISVDALACVCIYTQDRSDFHHPLTPVQRVEGKGEAKHLILPQPHKHLAAPSPLLTFIPSWPPSISLQSPPHIARYYC